MAQDYQRRHSQTMAVLGMPRSRSNGGKIIHNFSSFGQDNKRRSCNVSFQAYKIEPAQSQYDLVKLSERTRQGENMSLGKIPSQLPASWYTTDWSEWTRATWMGEALNGAKFLRVRAIYAVDSKVALDFPIGPYGAWACILCHDTSKPKILKEQGGKAIFRHFKSKRHHANVALRELSNEK